MDEKEYAKHIDEIVELRHYFHQHPELSNQEFNTTKKITEVLNNWGVKIIPTKLDTGLLAEIKGTQPGPVVGLRADIDALPVYENTKLVFKSQNAGIMHACGHDLHMSSLLGTIRFFQDHQDLVNGTLRFLFQPAEEAGGGADQVLQKDVLSGVQALIGFHNNPNLPVGTIALQPGPMMAGCYKFDIKIKGQGSHGAKPEKSKDPIVVLAAIISSLQTIVSRNIDPQDAVVVSVTHVSAGKVWNVIPGEATLGGTVRLFNLKDAAIVKKHLIELAQRIAAAYEEKVEVIWDERTLPIANDVKLTQAVINNLSIKVQKPVLSMAGEDFATYQKQIPGVFAFIGSNGKSDAADWHEPEFVGFDEMLPIGIQYFVEGTLGLLKYLK
ncbi:amidohydrolase [Liquorilactobacillus sicerae]|uniref:amidohydrolase n=1 Tax=Liquorilactobacillus sicerae TaxID=1416943 RepID=UPI002480F827|nr:amidohydrolase [Liquorilactobacillus sicerae]